jgi:hypothetical protein
MNHPQRAQEALMIAIARCPLVEAQFRDPSLSQRCTGVIKAQAPLLRETHQVPEPWSGRLDSAPVLFFGSNPSINPVEVFPTETWADDDVADFFANRFGGGRREWVKKLRVLRHDGTHGPPTEWVRFWAACRGRATELLGRQAIDGVDYAIAEAVHCKSKGERVVAEAVTKDAARTCADRYLRAVVDLSPARVIVSFGGISEREIRRIFGLGLGRYGRSDGRHFIFVDHPAGAGKLKKIASVLSAVQIEEIQSAIKHAAQAPLRLH